MVGPEPNTSGQTTRVPRHIFEKRIPSSIVRDTKGDARVGWPDAINKRGDSREVAASTADDNGQRQQQQWQWRGSVNRVHKIVFPAHSEK